jgi:hypothetical protein
MITERVIAYAPFFFPSNRLFTIGAVGSSNISNTHTDNADLFEGKNVVEVSGKSYARVLDNSMRIGVE